MKIKIGMWVAVTEDGIRFSSIEDSKFMYNTKAELVEEISMSVQDSRRVPKVKRISAGIYDYIPKVEDYNHDGSSYRLYKVSESTYEWLQNLLDDTIDCMNEDSLR